MKRFYALVFIILLSLFNVALEAQTAVPPLVNYQGTLTDSSGNPLAGSHALKFNLYNAVTGGNLVWGPQIFTAVPLIGGRFNVILGTTDTAGRSIADAFDAPDRFLGITVDSGAELAPRQQILSAPYAIHSDHAAKADLAIQADVAETVDGPILSVDSNTENMNMAGSISVNDIPVIDGEGKWVGATIGIDRTDCENKTEGLWKSHPTGFWCSEGYVMIGVFITNGNGDEYVDFVTYECCKLQIGR